MVIEIYLVVTKGLLTSKPCGRPSGVLLVDSTLLLWKREDFKSLFTTRRWQASPKHSHSEFTNRDVTSISRDVFI